MAIHEVETFFRERGLPHQILHLAQSSATVPLAAEALGVEPARIAKSLALKQRDGVAVLVVCGTARIDNRRYKDTFGCKAVMLSPEETLAETGHPVGGVCPFGLPDGVAVYLDRSLQRFATVYPAAGSGNTAVEFAPEELARATGATWVEVTQTGQTVG